MVVPRTRLSMRKQRPESGVFHHISLCTCVWGGGGGGMGEGETKTDQGPGSC